MKVEESLRKAVHGWGIEKEAAWKEPHFLSASCGNTEYPLIASVPFPAPSWLVTKHHTSEVWPLRLAIMALGPEPPDGHDTTTHRTLREGGISGELVVCKRMVPTLVKDSSIQS